LASSPIVKPLSSGSTLRGEVDRARPLRLSWQRVLQRTAPLPACGRRNSYAIRKSLQFLRDELTRKLNAAAALGVGVLEDLAMNARSEQVRLGAARELVDRGYGPVMSRNATITARVGIEDLLAQLDAREKDQPAGSILEGKIIAAGDDRFGEPDTYSVGS
jgi:hypothetical protein